MIDSVLSVWLAKNDWVSERATERKRERERGGGGKGKERERMCVRERERERKREREKGVGRGVGANRHAGKQTGNQTERTFPCSYRTPCL